jgi:hypothetical protein
MPKNNILVLLSSHPRMADEVLGEWAASVDGWRLYEQIIKAMQDPQSVEQLVLTLSALLCYQRLLPHIPDIDQPTKGTYKADFDAILNGERLGNARIVLEYLALSLLWVLRSMKGNEKMASFLVNALDIESPVAYQFEDFLIHYWVCRIGDRSHDDALKAAEKMI